MIQTAGWVTNNSDWSLANPKFSLKFWSPPSYTVGTVQKTIWFATEKKRQGVISLSYRRIISLIHSGRVFPPEESHFRSFQLRSEWSQNFGDQLLTVDCMKWKHLHHRGSYDILKKPNRTCSHFLIPIFFVNLLLNLLCKGFHQT